MTAGLLHDVLEDSPRYADEVRAFGPRVYDIVKQVSEAAKGAPQSILLSIERGRPVWPALTNPDPAEQVQRLRWQRDALAEGWDHPILAEYDDTLERLAKAAAPAARRPR